MRLCLLFLLTIPSTIFSQNAEESETTDSTAFVATDSLSLNSDSIQPGNLKVTGDERLSSMIEKFVEINQDDCPDIVQGYRVQIFSSSGTGSSQKAREIRNKFLSLYPKLQAYTDYEAPNFRVRIGNF